MTLLDMKNTSKKLERSINCSQSQAYIFWGNFHKLTTYNVLYVGTSQTTTTWREGDIRMDVVANHHQPAVPAAFDWFDGLKECENALEIMYFASLLAWFLFELIAPL